MKRSALPQGWATSDDRSRTLSREIVELRKGGSEFLNFSSSSYADDGMPSTHDTVNDPGQTWIDLDRLRTRYIKVLWPRSV